MKTSRIYVDPTASSVTSEVQAAADKDGAVPVVGLAARLIAEYMSFEEPRVLVENDDEAVVSKNVTRSIDMPSDK